MSHDATEPNYKLAFLSCSTIFCTNKVTVSGVFADRCYISSLLLFLFHWHVCV